MMPVEVRPDAIPDEVRGLCRKLQQAGHGAWVVGGGLRDLLRGREPKDWDIATAATPEQVTRLFRRVVPTGIAHGTVTVLQAEGQYEVTTLRGEGHYSDGRRPDSVAFVQDIVEDLSRRDFTVNAIALDPASGELIDPFGGLVDLQRQVLRTVGDPSARFGEDGLRVLRAARFVATLQFSLAEATEAAIAGALPVFAQVSAERVRDEWMKALAAAKPSLAFEVMRRTGILDVSCPDLVQLHGCPQNKYHAYDVWGHTMVCMDACIEHDPVHRLAGLFHDIGKPATRQLSDKTQDYTFYNHERVGADMAQDWLKAYRFSKDEQRRVVHLVRHHLICYTPEWTDAAVRRFVRRTGREHLAQLLALGRADAMAKGRPIADELARLSELDRRVAAVEQAGVALSTRDLAISGRDLMSELGLRPSPLIGRILEQLLEQVLDDPSRNEREVLLQGARRLAEVGLER